MKTSSTESKSRETTTVIASKWTHVSGEIFSYLSERSKSERPLGVALSVLQVVQHIGGEGQLSYLGDKPCTDELPLALMTFQTAENLASNPWTVDKLDKRNLT